MQAPSPRLPDLSVTRSASPRSLPVPFSAPLSPHKTHTVMPASPPLPTPHLHLSVRLVSLHSRPRGQQPPHELARGGGGELGGVHLRRQQHRQAVDEQSGARRLVLVVHHVALAVDLEPAAARAKGWSGGGAGAGGYAGCSNERAATLRLLERRTMHCTTGDAREWPYRVPPRLEWEGARACAQGGPTTHPAVSPGWPAALAPPLQDQRARWP